MINFIFITWYVDWKLIIELISYSIGKQWDSRFVLREITPPWFHISRKESQAILAMLLLLLTNE